MLIKLSNKYQEIFVFQLDKNNYIKFCPERGGVITNWVSEGNEILYLDEKRFLDKTKSIGVSKANQNPVLSKNLCHIHREER